MLARELDDGEADADGVVGSVAVGSVVVGSVVVASVPVAPSSPPQAIAIIPEIKARCRIMIAMVGHVRGR